jgi:lysophospholipase L1-like esterase
MRIKLIEEAALQIKFLQQTRDASIVLTDNNTDIFSGNWYDVTANLRDGALTIAVDGKRKLEKNLDPVSPIQLHLSKETMPLYIDDVEIRDEKGEVLFKDNFGSNIFNIPGLFLCFLAGIAAAFLLYFIESLIWPPLLRKQTPRKLREGFFIGWLALPVFGLVFGVYLKQATPLMWIGMVLLSRFTLMGKQNFVEDIKSRHVAKLLSVLGRGFALFLIALFLVWLFKRYELIVLTDNDGALFVILGLVICLVYFFLVVLKNRKQMKLSGVMLIFLFLCLMTAFEFALRYSPLNQRLTPMRTGENFRPDNALFFVPRDFFVAADGQGQGEPFILTGLNFRSGIPEKPKPEGRFRIMVMGGSNVWGDGIDNPKDVFSARLEKILKERHPDRDIEVINAGMKGYILFQLKLMLELYALDYQPDLIILYANRNDSSTQHGPYTLRELWESRKNLPSLDGVTETSRSTRPSLGRRLRAILRQSRLYNGLAHLIVGARQEQLANVTRKLKITKEVNPLEDYEKTLGEFVDLCRAKDIPLVLADEYMYWTLAPAPADRALLIKEIMSKTAGELKVPYLPVHAILTERYPDGSMMLKTDIVHLNKKGHLAVAELLADFLESNNLIEPGDD